MLVCAQKSQISPLFFFFDKVTVVVQSLAEQFVYLLLFGYLHVVTVMVVEIIVVFIMSHYWDFCLLLCTVFTVSESLLRGPDKVNPVKKS